MLELYITENKDLYSKLDGLLARHGCANAVIHRTKNGKPYVGGNPLFFSLAHSGNIALIALCSKSVGVDAEVKRERKYAALLSRFSAEERKEIAGAEDFLRHWVVREAYVKMLGATLAEKLDNLAFYGGKLSDGGAYVTCNISAGETENIIYCVCTEEAVSAPRLVKI